MLLFVVIVLILLHRNRYYGPYSWGYPQYYSGYRGYGPYGPPHLGYVWNGYAWQLGYPASYGYPAGYGYPSYYGYPQGWYGRRHPW